MANGDVLQIVAGHQAFGAPALGATNDVPADGTINGPETNQAVTFAADGGLNVQSDSGAYVEVKHDGTAKLHNSSSSQIVVDAADTIEITAGNVTVTIDSFTNAITLNAGSGRSIVITADGDIEINAGGGDLVLTGLATSNPGAGKVWMDAAADRVLKLGS